MQYIYRFILPFLNGKDCFGFRRPREPFRSNYNLKIRKRALSKSKPESRRPNGGLPTYFTVLLQSLKKIRKEAATIETRS